MHFSSRSYHLRRRSSLTSTIKSDLQKLSNPFRRTHLGKFSTSDIDEEMRIYNESQPHLEEFEQVVTEESNGEATPEQVEHPYIDSKLINSIFPPSEKVFKKSNRKTFSKMLVPFKFHEKDKILNDYVVSKLKSIINKKQEEDHLSKSRLELYYSTFLETFSITDLKKMFQCLESYKTMSLCKQYILTQLYTYYLNKNTRKVEKKQNQNILEIKMNTNLIKQHQATIHKTRNNITDLLNYKKQIKRVSTLESIESRTTRIKRYEDIVDRELRARNSQLVKQTSIVNRLQRSENNLKKNMCKKVDLLLGSEQYSQNGFGELYNDFVENGLDERVFSAFLGPKQMQFLRGKSSVERQIAKFQHSCVNSKPEVKKRIKNEISKYKNELIVMQEDIINKLKNDRHLEKNVYSLFGCGERGRNILERVRLNSPIKG